MYGSIRRAETLLQEHGRSKDAEYLAELMSNVLSDQEHDALRDWHKRKATKQRYMRYRLGGLSSTHDSIGSLGDVENEMQRR